MRFVYLDTTVINYVSKDYFPNKLLENRNADGNINWGNFRRNKFYYSLKKLNPQLAESLKPWMEVIND